MIASMDRVLEGHEYEACTLGSGELAFEDGLRLWERWDRGGRRVRVDFPSPSTGRQWVITPQGWVGQIPIRPGLTLSIQPKVPIGNLFGMLEVAYRLKSFQFLDGTTHLATLEDFFEHLASLLAGRVLARARRGFYREYVGRERDLSFVRGRLDLRRVACSPTSVAVRCSFRDHTGDVEDNRILAWTLQRVARSGACTGRSRSRVRRAYQAAAGVATPLPVSALACIQRDYHRLNEDYRTLHALCRFFLETSGPTTNAGEHGMLPFLVDMARLFEIFVAEWLRAALPVALALDAQHRHLLCEDGDVHWMMDLVLREAGSRRPIAVLDTKYKSSPRAHPADVAQVVAYAEALGCRRAYLVYPTASAGGFSAAVGSVQVRSLGLNLEGNLEPECRRFLEKLLADCA